MNTGRSGFLAIVARGITNPVWSVAFQGIADTARDNGLTVLFAGSGFEVEREREAIDLFIGKQIDGLIVSAADRSDAAHLSRIVAQGTPLVLWERRVEGVEAPVVEAEIRSASSDLTTALIDRGHRRIGFVSTLALPDFTYTLGTDLPASVIQDKVEGLLAPFQEHGIPTPTNLIRLPDRDRDAVASAFHSMLDDSNPPTALIANDSQVAEVMLDVVRSRGLKIPDDISLAMYDDLSWARLVEPPLTVIAQPDYEMGQYAARLAIGYSQLSAMDGLPDFRARLILRASVGRPPETN